MAEDAGSEKQSGMEQLRQAYDELKGKYEATMTENRTLKASAAFKDAGLNQKHADLFLRTVGDNEITLDAVKKFASDYDLVASNQPAGDKPAATPEPQPNPGLAQMAGAGTQATGSNPPSSTGPKMSMDEFSNLMQSNPAEAMKAYTDGRVEHAAGNPFVAQGKREGVLS